MPVPGLRNLLSSCWSGKPKRLLKQHRLSLLPLAAPQGVECKFLFEKRKSPWALDIVLRGLELNLTWKPPLWGLAFLELEVAMQTTKRGKQSKVLLSFDSYDQKGKISLKMQPRHKHLFSNQLLSNRTFGPLNRREIISGTAKLANYLRLASHGS